jgi:uncharacterized membrane protein
VSGHSSETFRVEAFSDAVIAIAITLLVLELDIPAASDGHLGSAIVREWPSYMAYLISFLTVGGLWLNHHALFNCLKATSPLLLRINLLLLLLIAFLPFPTKVMSYDMQVNWTSEIHAVLFYGLCVLACRLLLGAMWHSAKREGLIDANVADDHMQRLASSRKLSTALYAAATAGALAAPKVAPWAYLAVAAFTVADMTASGGRRRALKPRSSQ